MPLPDISALFDLAGKVAIVTGGAEGMGKEVCRTLAAAGASVAIADINLAWAEDAAREIVAAGGNAAATKIDLAEEDQIIGFVDAVRAGHGAIDILVNVAGLQDRALLEETTTALWDKLHAVNLRGAFVMMREAIRVMRADRTRGRIVNISSIGSLHPVLDGLVAYNSTKAGMNGLTRNAAYEVFGDGITVNAVLPGNTTTAGQGRSPGPPVDMAKIATMAPPLGRTGRVEDIAAAVLYLVSPASEWVTAQTLVVDGGTLNN